MGNGMRYLTMVIRAQNQSAAVFGDVARQMQGIQNMVGFWNRHNLTLPRTFSEGFNVLGGAINHAFGLGARALTVFNAQIKATEVTMRDGARAAARLASSFAPGTAGHTLWTAASNNMLAASQRAATLGGVVGGVAGTFQGLGAVFNAVFGLAGSLVNVLLQGFQAILGVVLQVASAIGSTLLGALSEVAKISGVVGLAVGAAVGMVGKLGLDFNSFKEQTLISFETLFKSPQIAKQKFDYLKQFADVTPFDTVPVIEAGKLLASYGLNIERYLPVAGNLAAAFNKPITQAVDMLGRASSGIYQARLYAPLGITHKRLESVGFEFDKAGRPTNRAGLLDAVERVAQRDFGNLMARQSLTSVGLFSTLKAWFTEEFPGAVTLGLDRARHAVMLFLVQWINVMRQSGQLDVILGALQQVYDIVGGLLMQLVRLAPAAANAFEQFVRSGGWISMLQRGWNVIVAVYNGIVSGIQWVAQNWDQIWNFISNVTLESARVIGGVFAGIFNVVQESLNGSINWKKIFTEIHDVMEDWSLKAVDAIFFIITVLGLLQMALGGIELAAGIAFKNVALGVKGVLDILIGGGMAIGSRILGPKMHYEMFKMFEGGTKFPDLSGVISDQGPAGAFLRGYTSFARRAPTGSGTGPGGMGPVDKGGTFDQWLQSLRTNQPLPSVPPFNFNIPITPGTALPGKSQVELDAATRKLLEDRAKTLKQEVEAWDAIYKAATAYTKVLGDQHAAHNMVVVALMGQLNALNLRRNIEIQLLQYETLGSKQWWQALEAANQTAESISKVREHMRDLIFDTTRLNAALDVSSKIFNLGKEAGFSPADMAQLGNEQLNLMLETLNVERGRLSTLQAGTVEWHKQRGQIVDIISKIVTLKKDLQEANNQVSHKMLMEPRTPYGMRGANFGAELVKDTGNGDFAAMIRSLLYNSLNVRPVSLDAVATSAFGRAVSPPPIPSNTSTWTGGPATQYAPARGVMPGWEGSGAAGWSSPSVGMSAGFSIGTRRAFDEMAAGFSVMYGPGSRRFSDDNAMPRSARNLPGAFEVAGGMDLHGLFGAGPQDEYWRKHRQPSVGHDIPPPPPPGIVMPMPYGPGSPGSVTPMPSAPGSPPPVGSGRYTFVPGSGYHWVPGASPWRNSGPSAGIPGVGIPRNSISDAGVGTELGSDFPPRHPFPWNMTPTPTWTPDQTRTADTGTPHTGIWDFWKNSQAYNDVLGINQPQGPWNLDVNVDLSGATINDPEEIKRLAHEALDAKLDAALGKVAGKRNRSR